MTQDDQYDLKPSDKPPRPKPGDPDFVPPVPIIEPPDPPSPDPDAIDPDVANNKAMAILAYVFFVIPLVAAPQSKFARFHANQGLLLFIVWCIALIIVTVLEVGWGFLDSYMWSIRILWVFLGCIFHVLVPAVLLFGPLALCIAGIINAANGERKGLPLIGHWTLIK